MAKARYKLPALDSGWITNISPLLLEQNKGYSDLLKNLDVEVIGVPKKRPGIAEVLGLHTKAILHAREYTNLATGVTYKVIFDGADWRKWEPAPTSAWTSFRTVTATKADSLVFANKLIMVDGTNASATWDGTTVATPAGFPVVSYLAEYRNRIIGTGDPNDPSLLYVSHTGDPTIWNPAAVGSNAIEIYVSPDDGEGVTGILNMGTGGVLIGKTSALYGLFGYTRSNITIDLLDSTIGSASHKAMQYIMPYAYFVNKDGIYRYSGSGGGAPEKISAPIQDYFDSNTNMASIGTAVAAVWGRYYIITLPKTGSGYYTLAYHTERNKWVLWDEPSIGAYFYASDDSLGKLYYTLPDGVKFRRFTPSILVDGAAAIAAEIETRELDADLPEVTKDFSDLYVYCSGVGVATPYTIAVSMKADDEAWTLMDTITVTRASRLQTVHRIVLGKTARFLKLKFTNSTTTHNFSPLGAMLTYEAKKVL